MTVVAEPSVLELHVSALRRAAVRAVRAPSVHNTQPWRIGLGPDSLTVTPDPSRRAPAFDPLARQLLLSCGCAAANAQIALAADGLEADLEVGSALGSMPALRVVLRSHRPSRALAELDPEIDRRFTPRTRLSACALPEGLLEQVQAAAAPLGVEVGKTRTARDRATTERLAGLGTRILCSYPEYLTELLAWTAGPARSDGLPSPAADAFARADRSADLAGDGVGEHELLWLATDGDDPHEWLRAGVVLERVLLQLSRVGLSAVPLTQLVEVPAMRVGLSKELGIGGYVHAVLRVGVASPSVPTRRRRLVDVIE